MSLRIYSARMPCRFYNILTSGSITTPKRFFTCSCTLRAKATISVPVAPPRLIITSACRGVRRNPRFQCHSGLSYSLKYLSSNESVPYRSSLPLDVYKRQAIHALAVLADTVEGMLCARCGLSAGYDERGSFQRHGVGEEPFTLLPGSNSRGKLMYLQRSPPMHG